jgi:4-cresol dehydrogenase (hydroxylating)
MNRIRHLDSSRHFVEVEPGVTQGQLAAHLKAEGDTHFLNITGAGISTSVLGNALERGIGYFGSRDLDLLGLEVMLANGEVIRTGYVPENGGPAAPLGPRLEGLFVQSGFGLVTSGIFSLSRKMAVMGAVTLDISDPKNLSLIVSRLGDVLAEVCILGVPHLFNRKRLETTFGGSAKDWPAWLAVVPIRGPQQLVGGIASELKGRFQDLARVRYLGLDHETGDSCSELQEFCPLLEGRPIDLALFSMAKTVCEEESGVPREMQFDPEKGNAGLIHVTPSCHLDGGSVLHLLDVVSRLAQLNGYDDLPMSLNIVSPRHACLIVSICYKRDSLLQKSSARKLAEALLAATTEEGFRPYRLGLEQAGVLSPLPKPLRRLCFDLQQTMDTFQLFAQSRYSSLWKSRGRRRNSNGVPSQRLGEAKSFLRTIEKQQQRGMRKLCSKNDAL